MAVSVQKSLVGNLAFPGLCRIPSVNDRFHLRGARNTFARCVGWLCGFALAATVLGCGGGPAVYPVSGYVRSHDGRRPTFGTIEFRSDSGGQIAAAKIAPDGSFRLSTFGDGDGALAGHHRAIIVQVINTEHLPLEQHHHVLDIHPRYARYETSGLEFTIEPGGKDNLEIVVDEAPRPPKKGR